MASTRGTFFCTTCSTISCTNWAPSIASSAATYSAEVLDLVTIACFLLAHATGHLNRKTTRPDMDMRST
ncbi:hypothetical protein PHMEG_0005638 [Phytophthora megakarya]|uniref:Uncharacterized protein n=1 Tax=Phytophthora megakarya TaxID=4795 RepID=A0A225WQX8_9STRA|nr:hypothetical protein PHMEG_0005638 [Phytophthora megakarya]